MQGMQSICLSGFKDHPGIDIQWALITDGQIVKRENRRPDEHSLLCPPSIGRNAVATSLEHRSELGM